MNQNPPLTKQQLAAKYGTPRQFADACMCVLGMISVDEAEEAIRKYNEEYAAAPEVILQDKTGEQEVLRIL